MTVESWLKAAIADAERLGLPELKSALESLAHATTALRAADFNDHATGSSSDQSSVISRQSAVGSPESSNSSRRS
jgi:hypothetical protein